MSDQKFVEVSRRVLAQSRKGQVTWSETSDVQRFVASFPSSSVSITRRPWEHERDWIYVFSVHNHLGTEVGAIRANPGDDLHNTLEELFENARRSALEPDEVLDDLLTRLGGDS